MENPFSFCGCFIDSLSLFSHKFSMIISGLCLEYNLILMISEFCSLSYTHTHTNSLSLSLAFFSALTCSYIWLSRQIALCGWSDIRSIPGGWPDIRSFPGGRSDIRFIPGDWSDIRSIPGGWSDIRSIPGGWSDIRSLPDG